MVSATATRVPDPHSNYRGLLEGPTFGRLGRGASHERRKAFEALLGALSAREHDAFIMSLLPELAVRVGRDHAEGIINAALSIEVGAKVRVD